MSLHRTLARQANKHLGELKDDPRLAEFLAAIDGSYRLHERDLNLLTRSMDLSAEEMTEKNRLLQQKNEALDTFVYRVSHDLKAPVNNVKAMSRMLTDIMKNMEKPAIADKIMGNIQLACDQLLVRIQDLLEMTRIDRNLDGKVEAIQLDALLEEILASVEAKVQESNAQIHIDFSAFPVIHFGKENLRSVLGNLVENAIKYRHLERDPLIRIQAQNVDGWCQIRIQDNGLGMDLEKQGDKLFGMFNRLHSHVDGSGIGLYLVKRIVEAKGGKIWVESQPNVGTTFHLTLFDHRD